MRFTSRFYNILIICSFLAIVSCSTKSKKDDLKKLDELVAIGKNNEAIQLLNEIISADSTNSDALILRAKLKYSLKDTLGMCNDISKAAALGNSDAAEIYKQYCSPPSIDELQNKIQLIEDLIQEDPNNPDGYYDLGNAYFDAQNYKEAINFYTTSISLDKNYSAAYYNRGVSYIKMNNKDSACPDIIKAASLNYELAKQNINLCK